MTARDRFEAFAARKIADATHAQLAGFAADFDRAPATFTAIGNAWTRQLFDGAFHLSPPAHASLPACSLVFVQSLDGNTGGANPSDLGGGLTDLHLIYEGLSRVAADAVLAGAATVGRGNRPFSVWHPELVQLRASLGKRRHPTQLLATLRGLDLENGLMFNLPDLPVTVITVPAGHASMRRALQSRPWIVPIVMSRPDELQSAFKQLRTLGIERVSAVGGRHLAAQLIDGGLVQDVYLTTSARDGGEPGTPMYGGTLKGEAIARKLGRGSEQGVVFEHLQLRQP